MSSPSLPISPQPLISLSHGRDRLGNVRPADGERLRPGLVAIAQTDGDTATTRKLAADAREHQGSGRQPNDLAFRTSTTFDKAATWRNAIAAVTYVT